MFAFYSGQPSPQYLFSKTQIIPAKRVILTRVFSSGGQAYMTSLNGFNRFQVRFWAKNR